MPKFKKFILRLKNGDVIRAESITEMKVFPHTEQPSFYYWADLEQCYDAWRRVTRVRAARARREKDQAYRAMGLIKIKNPSGKIYWE